MPKVCQVCSATYPDANVFCPVDGTTLRADALSGDIIGTVIADRYLVTDVLGEGGMGKVYLARHVRLPQQAAIKVLRAELIRDPASIARFNREAANASQVEDDCVARVYDFGETPDGMVYIAMEYVNGVSLGALIEREGALPPRRVAGLVRQIATGLDAAHALPQPLIHRDLKPDNILVVGGVGGRDRVKVVDFGIAKAFGTEDGGLTQTGFVVGTPQYMSPEQILGEPLDPRSDVYALALVAFRCLTGELPFDATSSEKTFARLVEPPRRLSEVRPATPWPPEVEQAFATALQRDRTFRPPSAGAFAELLADAIDDAWPDERTRGRRSSPVAHHAVAEAAAVATVAAAAPEASASHRADPPAVTGDRADDRRAEERRPRRRTLGVAAVVIGGVAAAVGAFSLSGSREPAPPLAPDTARTADGSAARGDSVSAPRTPLSSTTETRVRGAIAAPAPPPRANDAGAPARPGSGRELRSAADGGDRTDDGSAASDRDSDRQYAASLVLDSLGKVIAARSVDPTTARAATRALRELLPQLSRDDRTTARIRMIESSALSGDADGACESLRAARQSATRAEQRAEIRRLDDALGGCR